ncbi:Holliday junction branch migration protein RuvA ['Camptotheca acuminata' phytoplasma]|uniref:Holliday junction branch migration protein RuvA n=1 Tax='Camptotheca acuminata' phytoplasma TaxID=3239192 RepID=UPI00351A7398
MYFYIKGKIKIINNNSVVIENNDIGYFIHFSNPYIFALEQEVKLFTYFYVKENMQSLYGFLDLKTLNFFKKLIVIPGIGLKIAICLTNKDLLNDIERAISEDNAAYLVKIPGIGLKTAKQIIFHMQDNKTLYKTNQKKNDLLIKKQKNVKEALLNLGFKNKEIDTIMPKINFELEIENIIKEALLLLVK